jgi:FtsP/CotA-like multicopper oxidase with cupredoxin domain
MPAFAKTRGAALLAVVAVAAVSVAGSEVAPAAPVSIDLCAVTGTATPTNSVSVPVWGFVLKGTHDDCSDVQGMAGLPGPVLTADEGDQVTISVTNALPPDPTPDTAGTTDHVISFEMPGAAFAAGPVTADVGQTVTRTFTASAPGTYLYESGGDAGRQEAMGLYGVLIVHPATAGRAYDAAASAFDLDLTMVLSQLDPSFNAAPDTFDMNDYDATYWLINGAASPDTKGIAAMAGQRVLLRYVNAGYDNTSMSLLGAHEEVLARDGHLLGNPHLAAAETIPAGGTEDAIVTMPATAPPTPNGFPLFNRNLHVTNGSGATYVAPGGMLTFLHS